MKVIGIVGRVYKNIDNQKIIQINESIRKVLARYNDVVSVLILPVSNINYHNIKIEDDIIDDNDKKKLDHLLELCDGFIIPGGTYWYQIDEYVVEYAIKSKKPLLGICLGFQCICSMCALNRYKINMTRKLDNDNHYGEESKLMHKNIIIDNTKLSKILNKDSIMVNSLHHDYVDFPMEKLRVSSISDDNVIEAVELEAHPFFIALQWHPEYLSDDNSKKIFDAFIEAIKKLSN